MFKKLTLGALIVAVAYIGATWYTGTLVEQKLNHSVQRFADSTQAYLGDKVSLKVAQFEQGLFTSKAVLRLAINLPNYQENFDLAYDIENGPLPFSALKQGQFAPALALYQGKLLENTSLKAWFNQNADPLTDMGMVTFAGDFKGKMVSKPYQLQHEHIQLNIGNAVTDYDFNPKSKLSKQNMKFDHMNYSINTYPGKFTFTFKNFQMDSVADLNDSRINYSLNSSVEEILVSEEDFNLSLKGMASKDSVTDDGQFLSYRNQSSVQDLLVNTVSYGMLNYNVAASHLDSAPTKEIVGIYANLMAQSLFNMGDYNAMNDLMEQNFTKMGLFAMQIAAKNPQIEYGPFTLKNPEGEMSTAFTATLKAPDPANTQTDLDTGLQLFKQIDINFNASSAGVTGILKSFANMAAHMEPEHKSNVTTIDYGKINTMLEKAFNDTELFNKEGSQHTMKFNLTLDNPNITMDKLSFTLNGQPYSISEIDSLLEAADRFAESLMESGFNEEYTEKLPPSL